LGAAAGGRVVVVVDVEVDVAAVGSVEGGTGRPAGKAVVEVVLAGWSGWRAAPGSNDSVAASGGDARELEAGEVAELVARLGSARRPASVSGCPEVHAVTRPSASAKTSAGSTR